MSKKSRGGQAPKMRLNVKVQEVTKENIDELADEMLTTINVDSTTAMLWALAVQGCLEGDLLQEALDSSAEYLDFMTSRQGTPIGEVDMGPVMGKA